MQWRQSGLAVFVLAALGIPGQVYSTPLRDLPRSQDIATVPLLDHSRGDPCVAEREGSPVIGSVALDIDALMEDRIVLDIVIDKGEPSRSLYPMFGYGSDAKCIEGAFGVRVEPNGVLEISENGTASAHVESQAPAFWTQTQPARVALSLHEVKEFVALDGATRPGPGGQLYVTPPIPIASAPPEGDPGAGASISELPSALSMSESVDHTAACEAKFAKAMVPDSNYYAFLIEGIDLPSVTLTGGEVDVRATSPGSRIPDGFSYGLIPELNVFCVGIPPTGSGEFVAEFRLRNGPSASIVFQHDAR